MSELRVGVSPITNNIFAGYLNERGDMWKGKKHDITDEAVMAVVQYIKSDAVIYERDGVKYQLKEVQIDD